jgi:hypothetical protein
MEQAARTEWEAAAPAARTEWEAAAFMVVAVEEAVMLEEAEAAVTTEQ